MLRFVLVYGLLLAAFNAFFVIWFNKSAMFNSYLSLNASICGLILRVFGDNPVVSGTSISSARFSLDVKAGCDAIQASAFFIFGVLASPVGRSLLSRAPALLIGTMLLLVMNLVRIVSLYYTGIYYPSAFDAMHVEVWQALFIIMPLFLWVNWARRAGRTKDAVAHVVV